VVKGFNLSIDYVLYEMSYANVIMYNAVIPSYHDDDGKEIINADESPEALEGVIES
jgi:hypothetical protein